MLRLFRFDRCLYYRFCDDLGLWLGRFNFVEIDRNNFSSGFTLRYVDVADNFGERFRGGIYSGHFHTSRPRLSEIEIDQIDGSGRAVLNRSLADSSRRDRLCNWRTGDGLPTGNIDLAFDRLRHQLGRLICPDSRNKTGGRHCHIRFGFCGFSRLRQGLCPFRFGRWRHW